MKCIINVNFTEFYKTILLKICIIQAIQIIYLVILEYMELQRHST